jgi:manganese/zinc/iron transport system ATP- binding protein
MKYALEAEDLSISYEETAVLWDITFQVPSGVILAILGPNGAGKSTLLKAALKLIKPLSGKISLGGKVAYVPQKESIDWDFPITAEEVVLMGRYGRLGLFGRIRKADLESAALALDLVGMSGFAKRQIAELSGGQQQRLFLARALLQNPDIFLLDEPFTGVDLATEKAIMALLRKQKEAGKTILIVHHDLPTVEEYFDWALLLNTQLIDCGPISSVFHKKNLARTFGKEKTLFSEAADLSIKKMSGIL